MSSQGPTATLCEWVCSTRYEDLPDEVRQEALRVLYDAVGGMIASATLESCRPVVELVRSEVPADQVRASARHFRNAPEACESGLSCYYRDFGRT